MIDLSIPGFGDLQFIISGFEGIKRAADRRVTAQIDGASLEKRSYTMEEVSDEIAVLEATQKELLDLLVEFESLDKYENPYDPRGGSL